MTTTAAPQSAYGSTQEHEALRPSVRSLAGTAQADRGAADVTYASAAAECPASDTAMSLATDGVRLFGGYGCASDDLPVERCMPDATITQIRQGANQIQRVVMARALLR